jgi:hypothetical protein
VILDGFWHADATIMISGNRTVTVEAFSIRFVATASNATKQTRTPSANVNKTEMADAPSIAVVMQAVN